MQVALSIKDLQKTYANQLHALKGIDLQVEQGDFFALLGSNGAGKTTAIGIICGLLHKTHGNVKILGLDQDTHENEVKRLIGLMPQEFNFNPFEPVEEILINQAGFHGINKSVAKAQSDILLKKMELWDKRLDQAKSLSGGMKRRLMLARALIHQPKILILDEPTAGVDVEIRRSMWAYLKELNSEGMTIILTTHYLEEAESLCRNIAILNEGEVVEQTSMKKLLAKVSHQVLILESSSVLPKNITQEKFTCERLDDHSLQVVLESDTNITDVLQNLSNQGVSVDHVRSTQNRLET
ncbi:MAG TPA: ABC transporter, partial [Gammaproteobacteria bacterium]|nr:ABC transporter [Gammaproteobacteria bacterium]